MKKIILFLAISVGLLFACQPKSDPNGTNSAQKTSNTTAQKTSNTPTVQTTKLGNKTVELEKWYHISFNTRIRYKEINGMIYGLIESDVYGGSNIQVINFTKDKAELDYYNSRHRLP